MSRSTGTAAEIAYWLGTRRNVPTVEEIMGRWSVSRATGFRWRAFALSGGRAQDVRERTPEQRYDDATRPA